MEITCYRDFELANESRFLPAAAYNLVHTMLARSNTGHKPDEKRLRRNIPIGRGSHDGKDVTQQQAKNWG